MSNYTNKIYIIANKTLVISSFVKNCLILYALITCTHGSGIVLCKLKEYDYIRTLPIYENIRWINKNSINFASSYYEKKRNKFY